MRARTRCTTTAYAQASSTTPRAATTTRPQDSAAIVRSIYAYHTRTLGWCDIAYNALVDKYGQVFEGRAGGMDQGRSRAPTPAASTRDTWGVAMIGNFEDVPPTADPGAHRRTAAGLAAGPGPRRPEGHSGFDVGRWHRSPTSRAARPRRCRRSSPTATSATPNARATRPTRRWTRSATSRHVSTNHSGRPSLTDSLRGGAILAKWESMGGENSPLGAPTITGGRGRGQRPLRHLRARARSTGRRRAGPNPLTGAIYEAWASLGYERGALGLPTSGEIQNREWIVQNFQHGTLNFDREKGTVTTGYRRRCPEELPPPLGRRAARAARAVQPRRNPVLEPS